MPMPDNLLNALREYAHLADFRASAASFMSLNRAAIDKMVEVVNQYRTFSIPAAGIAEFEVVANQKGAGMHIFTAARLIRDAARDIPDDTMRHQELSSFASMIGADSYDSENFSTFFASLPALDAKERRSRTVTFAPTLEAFSMVADLRMVMSENDQLTLVPVCFARLEFDELVAGQHSHFFQVTEKLLSSLEREVVRMRGLLAKAREHFPVDDGEGDDDGTRGA